MLRQLRRRFHPLPLALVLLGLLASLVTAVARYRAEARSRAVFLVLDRDQVESLAATTGTSMLGAYSRFKAAGIRGVAITAETLADLQVSGMLEIRAAATETGREYKVVIADPEVQDRVAQHVSRYARGATEQVIDGDRLLFTGPGGTSVRVPGRFDGIKLTPTGLDPRRVREVTDAGLEPVARIPNTLGLTADAVHWTAAGLAQLGVHTVIFSGEEVLGFRDLVKETAAAFREHHLLYGDVEMGKQRGNDKMAALMMDQMVRVHSIAAAEMPRLTPQDAIERYARAAEERNIRLNYVRLPSFATEHTFEDSVAYVRSIAQEIVKARFGLAAPVPFGRVWPEGIAGRLPAAAIGLGVGAGAVLLLAGLVPVAMGTQAVLALVAAGFCALCALSGVHLLLQADALLAAVVFPTLAFVLLPQPLGAFEDHRHVAVPDKRLAWLPAIAEFSTLSAVTLIGALMVAGLLSELPYMVKVKSFAGIKLATVVPLLGVGAIYVTGATGLYPSWAEERADILARVRRLLEEPFRLWHIVALGIGLVALALVVARSGNDPGIGVSETELRFRALLDRILGVRPRTKEFLVGHPALLLGLAMATLPRWRGWALPVLLVGVIGQVGMLNSFCHLHSPLKVTVLRTVNGLWIGGLLGLLLIAAWTRLTGTRNSKGAARR